MSVIAVGASGVMDVRKVHIQHQEECSETEVKAEEPEEDTPVTVSPQDGRKQEIFPVSRPRLRYSLHKKMTKDSRKFILVMGPLVPLH